MFDAQTINLQTVDTSTNQATDLYSPWFPRGGDYGIFTMEVMKMSGTSANLQLTVEMYNKKASDAGNGTAVTSSSWSVAANATLPTRASKEVTAGFLELVRYKFTLKWAAAGTTGTNYWATFRMLAPVWYDKV